MSTQFHLPAQPERAVEINSVVAMVRARGKVAYFASGVPIFLHDEADRVGKRVAAAQILTLGLARQDELSQALEVNRTTLYRQQCKLTANGEIYDMNALTAAHQTLPMPSMANVTNIVKMLTVIPAYTSPQPRSRPRYVVIRVKTPK